MDPLAGLWAFLQPYVTGFLVKTGSIKILGLLRRKPSDRALALAIERFAQVSEESFSFILKNVFESETEFKNKFVTKYKSRKEEYKSELAALLEKYGAKKDDLESSLKSFLDIFDECLNQVDKRKTSEVADSQQTGATYDMVKELHNKLINPQLDQVPVAQDKRLEIQSPATESMDVSELGVVGTEEFNGTNYKSRADAIKVSMDERQFKSAKQMCLTLIADLEADSTATSVMKFWIYRKTAICSRKLAQNPEASEFHDKAYDAVGPVCVEALCGKAEACWLRGKPEEGLEVIDTALTMDSENKDCLNLKGSLLIAAGRPDEAIKLYEELNDGTKT